jgi:hypothetical protein
MATESSFLFFVVIDFFMMIKCNLFSGQESLQVDINLESSDKNGIFTQTKIYLSSVVLLINCISMCKQLFSNMSLTFLLIISPIHVLFIKILDFVIIFLQLNVYQRLHFSFALDVLYILFLSPNCVCHSNLLAIYSENDLFPFFS